jgi:hypothetical protein
MLTCTSRSRALDVDALACSAVFSCPLALAHAVLSSVDTQGALASEWDCVPVPSGAERALPEEPSANAREHAWCVGPGVRSAGACSGESPVLEDFARLFISQRISGTLLRRPLVDLR